MQVLEKISLTPIWVIATLLDEFLGGLILALFQFLCKTYVHMQCIKVRGCTLAKELLICCHSLTQL